MATRNRNPQSGHAERSIALGSPAFAGDVGEASSAQRHSEHAVGVAVGFGPRLALPVFTLALLGLARVLTPAADGFGTHEQLGIPACVFRALTGVACPCCGLTTAFAWLARGELGLAHSANPLGVMWLSALVIVSFGMMWAPLRELLTRVRFDSTVRIMITLALLTLTRWFALTWLMLAR